MNKKLLIVLIVAVFSIGGLIIVFDYLYPTKVGDFNLSEYYDIITEFSSDRVLGPVDDAKTAKEKAEHLWVEIYGEFVREEKPYQVFFDKTNDVWLVTGTLPQPLFGEVVGGVAYILLRKVDGKVLAVWHYK